MQILQNWEQMKQALNQACDGQTFYVVLDHNAFLLKQAVMRKGLKNITIAIVRESCS